MKKIFIIILIILSASIYFFIQNSKLEYQNGVYSASSTDAYGETKVTLEFKDGKIVKCELLAYDKDGNLKDENYGKDSGAKNYELAQISLKGFMQYPELLLKTQNIDEVDAISGATGTFMQFKTLVQNLMRTASGR